MTTSASVSQQRELHVGDGFPDGLRAVEEDIELRRAREHAFEHGNQLLDVRDDLDRVLAGLLLDREDDAAGRAVLVDVPRRRLVVLDAVDGAADVPHPHRRPVPVGHDERAVLGRLRELAGGLHRVRRVLAPERPRRDVHVRGGDGGGSLVDSDAPVGERARVDLDAHGVFLRAEHLHLRDAGDRRDALRHDRLGVLVERREGERRRGEGDVEDGLVGRIDLLICGRARHPGRELARGGADGGLHVLGGRVEAAAQAELKRHLRDAEDARRVHVVEARDRRELPLERRRDRGGHRLGARSRERRGHLDRRKVHVRQVRNREEPVAHDAEEEDPHHHERRGDRAPDEDLGNVHQRFTISSPREPRERARRRS